MFFSLLNLALTWNRSQRFLNNKVFGFFRSFFYIFTFEYKPLVLCTRRTSNAANASPALAIIFEDQMSASEGKPLGDPGLVGVTRPSTTIGSGWGGLM